MVEEPKQFLMGEEVLIKGADFANAKQYIGRVGVIISTDDTNPDSTYLVSVEGKDPWWYMAQNLEPVVSVSFNELSQDERTLFIRNLVGQMYLYPTAYVHYKRVYKQIETQHGKA